MMRQATRRELVHTNLVRAAAGIIAGSALWPAAARSAQTASDRDVLARVHRIESLVVYCYEQVLAAGTLRGTAQALVVKLLGHEREHVAALERELAWRGETPTSGWNLGSARRELARRHVGASLTELGTQHRCLHLLVDVESMAEGAWFAALAKLSDPALAALGASIMACEAQHWTLLSGLSHHGDVKEAVPYPFVRGSSGY